MSDDIAEPLLSVLVLALRGLLPASWGFVSVCVAMMLCPGVQNRGRQGYTVSSQMATKDLRELRIDNSRYMEK